MCLNPLKLEKTEPRSTKNLGHLMQLALGKLPGTPLIMDINSWDQIKMKVHNMIQLLIRGNFEIGAYFLQGKRKCAGAKKCQLWKNFGNSIFWALKWYFTVPGPQMNENIWVFLQFYSNQYAYRTNLDLFQGDQSQSSEQIFWEFFKLLFIFSKLSRNIESAFD